MSGKDVRQSSQPIKAVGAMASAMAVVTPAVSYTLTPTLPKGSAESRAMPISPQDLALIDAKIDAKLAEQKGDLKLATQTIGDLKERFNDLAAKMASVPTDIAGMKRDIAHLPSKEELGAKLRNYILLAVALIGCMIGIATFIIKTLPVGAGAAI